MNLVPDGQGSYRIPPEMMRALLPAMQSLGVTPPDVANLVPKVNLDTPVRDMALQVGQLLRKAGLFRYGPNEVLVTFDKERRKMKAMTPLRFCSWIERHTEVVKSYKGRGGETYDAPVSMGKDMAAKILEADEFLREIPIIEALIATRVPVNRGDGRMELCKAGWDEEARIFCYDEVPFATDWTLDRGLKYIEDLNAEFLFADLQPGRPLWHNRSFLVHVSAMVGIFVRKLLPPGTVRPLVFYVANEQGSGKSLLVSMLLAACFGQAASTDLPVGAKGLNQEKFTALLETVAQSMKEFLWLDDVPPSVFSNALNRFTTAGAHTGRKYGGNDELFDVVNVTQTFLTGNNVEMTRDLMQRALVCELFLSVDSQTRPIKRRMTEMWLSRPEQRADLQAALWAIVRHWHDDGMRLGSSIQSRAPDWSALVSGILEAAGVASNPFAVPELPMGGDRETEEWKELLVALADDAIDVEGTEFEAAGRQVDTTKLVKMARDRHLLADLVGSADDKPLKGGELKKLGRRLAKWRGREDLRSTSGRRFRFGKRKQANNWVYPIEWLDVATTAGESTQPDQAPTTDDQVEE